MTLKLEDARKAIEEVVRERFDTVKIVSVDVEDGFDEDGDRVFFVRVVFDSDIKKFNVSRLSGITRHLRSRLSDLGDERFPYTRFVARDDLDGVAA